MSLKLPTLLIGGTRMVRHGFYAPCAILQKKENCCSKMMFLPFGTATKLYGKDKDPKQCATDSSSKIAGAASKSAGASGDSKAPARIKRMEPGKVELGFIPAEWANAFHSRTGVSGFYTFCFTFGIYLLSKETLVLEHNYYGGLSMLILCYVGTDKVGPIIAKALDRDIDAIEAGFNEDRINEKNMLETSIQWEEKLQLSSEGQLMLLDAKRENVQLQLEANFRERQMMVYNEVKNLLDYHLAKEDIERRMAQRNIVDWVTTQVLKSITPEQESQNIDRCIEDLAAVAKK